MATSRVAKQTHCRLVIITMVGLALLAAVTTAIAISAVLSSESVEQRRLKVEARLERLEFCVNHGIAPCGYEQLKEWNERHHDYKHFAPRVDDGFYDFVKN